MWTLAEVRAVLRRHFRLTVGAAAALVVAVVTVLVVFVFTSGPAPSAQPDISSNFKVCLLDSAQGEGDAKIVWNGVQSATKKVPINAQQLTVPAGSGVDPAPYLNSLVQLHCQLVITSGVELADALKAAATNNPDIRFLHIGDPVDLPNVRTVQGAAVTSTLIRDEVLDAARRAT